MVNAAATASITAEPAYVDPSQIIFPLIRPPVTPAITPPGVPAPFENRHLIINIETTGFDPLKDRIISIGIQNPLLPDELPVVLMHEKEEVMLNSLFTVIKEGGYGVLVGYGMSFDYRFILVKAMKHNIECKEFYDCDLLDMGQAMAQGKFEFVYFAQRQPKLSDVGDFFWSYPKPFTDLEMLKY